MQKAAKVFGQVTLLVVDQLQAYNIKAQSPELQSKEATQTQVDAMRDGWLTENWSHLLQGAKLPANKKKLATRQQVAYFNETAEANGNRFRLKTWKDWVGDKQPDIDAKHNELKEVPEINEAVSEFSSHYAQRDVRSELSDRQKAQLIHYSSQFVFQEAIGLFLLAKAHGISHIGYTGSMSQAFSVIREKLHQTEVKWLYAYPDKRDIYWKEGSKEEAKARQALEKAQTPQASAAPSTEQVEESNPVIVAQPATLKKSQDSSTLVSSIEKLLTQQEQSYRRIVDKQTQFMCLWSGLSLFFIAGLTFFYQSALAAASESNYSPYQS